MQGIILFVLVATIATAPDVVQGRQLTSSFLQELARMMLATNKLVDGGTCGSHGCCVVVTREGREERKLLGDGEQLISPTNSCEVYTCTKSGLSAAQKITCAIPECTDANPLTYFPGRCCPICKPPDTEGECEFTPWSDYGQCSVTCGGGQMVRVREVISVDDSGSSVNCQGQLTEFKNCSEQPCEVHCEYEERTEGSCVPNCGGGEIRKFIVITQQPLHGGRPCPPTDVEVTQCCQNCEYTEQCGTCSKTCHFGTRTCTPLITKPAVAGGTPCPGSRTENCNEGVTCPVDCEYEDVCTDCSRNSAGSCTRTCTPRITRPAVGTGKQCPTGSREEQCDPRECPVDCQWVERTEGQCIPNCGGGQLTKYYVITQQAMNGGQECPAHVRESVGVRRTVQCCQNCEKKAVCGACESLNGRNCGAGKMECTETITKEALAGGEPCSALQTEEQSCTLDDCPPCRDDEHVCMVKDVSVCVKNTFPGCDCVLQESNNKDDIDNDYIHNMCDNCRTVYNDDQADDDGDSVGDKCDNCPGVKSREDKDFDGDGIPDECDPNNYDGFGRAQQWEVNDKKSTVVAMMEKLLKMYYDDE